MHRYYRTTTLVRLALALGLLGGSGVAQALGLGKFVLRSGLDEPLNAEIEISAANENELKSLKAGLAPRDEFDNAGIDRPEHLTLIKYILTQRSDGTPLLKLTTDEPIREPFLHFLVQAQWAGGRIVREYTALLDPPHLASAKAPALEAPSLPAPPADTMVDTALESAAQLPAPGDAPASDVDPANADSAVKAAALESNSSKEDAAASSPHIREIPAPVDSPGTDGSFGDSDGVATTAPAEPAKTLPAPIVRNDSDWSTRTEYQVKRGDTLSKIVRDINFDNSLSAEQVMLAMLKTNKAAFFDNNINNLKAGKILKVPARGEVEANPKPKALKEFRAQYNSWQEYKLKLASSSQLVRVAGADKGGVRGDIAAQPAGAATETGGKDLLKIVRAENEKLAQKGAGGTTNTALPAKERQALMDKAATLEEALASRELENKELRERVTQLEAQIKNAKRLVEIENKELAKTQKQVAEPKQPEIPATTKTPGPAPVATQKAISEQAAAASPAAKPAQATATKKRAAPAQPPPAEEGGLLDSVLTAMKDMFTAVSDVLTLSIVGGAVAIAGGAFLIYYRRRRRAMAEFGESILSGGLNLNSEGSAQSGGQGEKSADVSFLSDFSQGGMGNIHTDEVDPIAEADVYLAYGRDEQAEEILKEAVIKDPTRHELRLKLLEIYQQRKDLHAFETVAEELYAALEGKGGRVWERAEEMGQKMNPQNPLFRGAANRAAVAGRTGFEAASGLALQGAAPVVEGFDLDLSQFSSPSSAPAASTEAEDSFSLDLDFSNRNETGSGTSVSHARESNAGHSGGIDFDFSALTTSTGATSESVSSTSDFEISFDQAPKATEAGSGIDFGELSLEGEAAVDEVSSDEIATKLDLAKAYIDMGDADGARSILDEVLAEGSDAQKKQAADLAAQIAA